MTTLEDLLHVYANEGVRIEENGTSAGYYTHYGLLSKFLLDVKPIIEAQAREKHDGKETPEQVAERFVIANGERFIQAIKEYRKWAQANGIDSGLKTAKDMCDAARARLGDRVPQPKYNTAGRY